MQGRGGAANLRFTINPPETWLNVLSGQIPHFPPVLTYIYLKHPALYNKFIICLSNISPSGLVKKRLLRKQKCKGKGKWADGVEALLQKGQVSPVLENRKRDKEMYAAAVVLWGGMRRQNCAIGSASKTSKTLRHKSHFRSLKSGSSKTDLGSRRKRCQKCAKYFQMWREF